MGSKKKEETRKLAALRDTPDEQAALAVQLLAPKYGLEVVRAAVGVLEKHPAPNARQDLRRLYWHYAEHNGTRDPAAYTRTAILKALRQVMGMDDVALVVHAVTTYEFLPPSFTEEASLLRSAAIVLLAELDDRPAKFFATRLLADGYTEPMSGEPAKTAVRVLALLGEQFPLYFYAMQQHGSHPEVVSECLRNLGDVPSEVLAALVGQYSESEDSVALVGLFDLLLSGPDAPRHADYLCSFLRNTCDIDLYRYLVTVMVTSTSADVRQTLADTVRTENNAEKVEALAEALMFAPDSPEMAALKLHFA